MRVKSKTGTISRPEITKETFNRETLTDLIECIQKSGRKIGFVINHAGNGESSVTIENMRLQPKDLEWLNQLK